MGAIAISLLAAMLLVAVVLDVGRQRIPNFVSIGTLASGIAFHAPLGMPAVGFSLAGAGIGLISFLPLYALRGMGAGDVKMMAGVGSFLGPGETLWAVAATLIAGGFLAIFYFAFAVWRAQRANAVDSSYFLQLLFSFKLRTGAMKQRFPYATAIACGTAIAMFLFGKFTLPFLS